MKTLKDIITEKLKISKNMKLTKEEYSFDEFKNLLKSILNTEVDKSTFKLITKYVSDVEDLTFIDVTNDEEELNYYEKEILLCIDDKEFENYYLIQADDSSIFFHYLNIDVMPDTMVNQMRYGYIVGNSRQKISETHIFKIKI